MSATTPTTRQERSPRRGPDWSRFLRNRMQGLLSLVVFILLWQLVIEIFDPQPLLFPTPGAVASEFVEAAGDGTMWPAFTSSMYAMAVGLGLALVTGIPLGLMIGMSPTADMLTSPYLWGLFAMPRIALAPLMILWFGFGMETKVWLVYLSAVIPLMLSCKDGVQTADVSLIQAARSFGAGRLFLFRKVIAPSTLPFISSGIRNGISRGFVGLLVIELTTGSGGIGSQVMRSMSDQNTARMFAFTLLLIVVALVLISLSRQLERYSSRWREEVAL